MPDTKIENYQVTVYKFSEFKELAVLSNELESKIDGNKELKNNAITELDSKAKVLYFSFITNNTGNDVSWYKKWANFFGIANNLRASSSTGHGAIIIELPENREQYVLTFGRSAYLFKDSLIHNYGIKLAGRLFNGKNVDSVSSKYFALTKNKSLVSYAQGSSYDFEEGEAADLLKATIEEPENGAGPRYIEELLKYVKSIATISYSYIKLTIRKEDIKLDDLVRVVTLLSKIEETYSHQFDIPQMKPIAKSQEQILNDKLWEAIKSKDKSIIFSIPIFTKDINDYYVFLDSIDTVTLKYRHIAQQFDDFDIDDFFSFVENNPKIESLSKIHCIVESNQIKREEHQFSRWLEAQIEHEGVTYALHNGKWYSFNDNYLLRVNNRITEIEETERIIVFDDSFSAESQEIDKFCGTHSDEIKLLFSDDGNASLSDVYREFRYNFYIAKQRGWRLFDRCISENVELCDLCNPNDAFIHCKIGKTTNLEECLRQSLISLIYFSQRQPDIEKFKNRNGEELTHPKEIVILFLSESEIDSNFKISTLRSLKCKLTFLNWYKQCKLMRYQPKLIIARYNKTKM